MKKGVIPAPGASGPVTRGEEGISRETLVTLVTVALGSTLRQMRSTINLTQVALGKLLGRTSNYICQVESGARPITLDNFSRLCLEAGVPPLYLFALLQSPDEEHRACDLFAGDPTIDSALEELRDSILTALKQLIPSAPSVSVPRDRITGLRPKKRILCQEGIDLGFALGLVRKARGLTQKELAETLNVTQHYLCLVEANKRGIRLSTLTEASIELHVPLRYILLLSANDPMRMGDPESDRTKDPILQELLKLQPDILTWINLVYAKRFFLAQQKMRYGSIRSRAERDTRTGIQGMTGTDAVLGGSMDSASVSENPQ
jgi:transcriptional regulator with XRE-family HTH domain